MHEGCEADAALDGRRLILTGKPFPLEVVLAQLESAVHQLVEVHRLAYDLAYSQALAFMYEVSAPKLLRKHVETSCNSVHVALQSEDALRRPEAAKRPVRRMIRGHCLTADAYIRAYVGTARMNCAAR